MLKGEDIPYLARITAIADSFDAMTSKRSYRDSLPLDIVIEEFKKNRGTQFDPDLDDLFVDLLENHYEEIKEIQEKYKDFILIILYTLILLYFILKKLILYFLINNYFKK